jgi:hypothetical protein
MLVLREKEFSGNNVGSVRCVGVEVESSTFGMLLQDIATLSPQQRGLPFFSSAEFEPTTSFIL